MHQLFLQYKKWSPISNPHVTLITVGLSPPYCDPQYPTMTIPSHLGPRPTHHDPIYLTHNDHPCSTIIYPTQPWPIPFYYDPPTSLWSTPPYYIMTHHTAPQSIPVGLWSTMIHPTQPLPTPPKYDPPHPIDSQNIYGHRSSLFIGWLAKLMHHLLQYKMATTMYLLMCWPLLALGFRMAYLTCVPVISVVQKWLPLCLS